MPRFILSCENKQELVDLIAIAQALRDTQGHDVEYFDITPLLAGGKGEWVDTPLFKRQWCAKAIQGQAFKEMPAGLKLLTSLINASYLVFLYYSRRADFLLVGTPLLTYRLARMLTFGNLRLVTYIRGIIAYSDENTSVSSRIFTRFSKLMRLRAFASIVSDYYSDFVICTGEVTARFIGSRGVPTENIHVAGSVYCDSLTGDEGHKDKKTVVFVSSAFTFHGYHDAQQAQTAMIRSISEHLAAQHPQVGFVVRIHPREGLSCYDNGLAQFLDAAVGDPLTSYPSNALFISPISTLIFEMAYADRQSYLVADPFFVRRFNTWYKAVGVVPILDWRILIDNYVNGNAEQRQDFTNCISTRHKGNVVAKIARELSRNFGTN